MLGTYTWIGVSTDNGSKGRWYWADGSNSNRQNTPWGAIQPNDQGLFSRERNENSETASYAQ